MKTNECFDPSLVRILSSPQKWRGMMSHNNHLQHHSRRVIGCALLIITHPRAACPASYAWSGEVDSLVGPKEETIACLMMTLLGGAGSFALSQWCCLIYWSIWSRQSPQHLGVLRGNVASSPICISCCCCCCLPAVDSPWGRWNRTKTPSDTPHWLMMYDNKPILDCGAWW